MTQMEVKKPVTIDDMYHMPEDGQKYELVNGEIVVSPAGMPHAQIVLKIVRIVAAYLDENPIGEVFGDNVGLIFPNGNLRSPDLFVIRREAIPDGKLPEGFGRFVPDFAVEVLSPIDRQSQVAQKIGEFLEYGVKVVWLVDPQDESVTVYRSLTQTQRFSSNDFVDAEPVLPGFVCKVSKFFPT
jgi:Uma2 family endonuclease